MRRVVVLGALLVLALSGSARAVTLVTPDGQMAQPEQGLAAASRIATAHETLVLTLDPAACDGHYGCTDCRHSLSLDRPEDAIVLYHELGHVFDCLLMSDPDRATYQHLRGLDGEPWQTASGTYGDHETAAEDFAERYAECAEGIGNAAGTGWICGFVRNVAARHPGAVDPVRLARHRGLRHHHRRGEPR